MGGKERKEVLKLGRWEKRKEIANEKYQITNESRSSAMGVDECQNLNVKK